MSMVLLFPHGALKQRLFFFSFRCTARILPQIIHFPGKSKDNTQVLEGKILKTLTVE
jgi:hypothetical protein